MAPRLDWQKPKIQKAMSMIAREQAQSNLDAKGKPPLPKKTENVMRVIARPIEDKLYGRIKALKQLQATKDKLHNKIKNQQQVLSAMNEKKVRLERRILEITKEIDMLKVKGE